MWLSLSHSEKFNIVSNLHSIRLDLLKKSRNVVKTKRKKKAEPMKFRSKELERIFYSMPIESQKLIRGC